MCVLRASVFVCVPVCVMPVRICVCVQAIKMSDWCEV